MITLLSGDGFQPPTNGLQNFERFFTDSQVIEPTNTARGAPVAFVTTEQRKAGLIPAKFTHETVRSVGQLNRCAGLSSRFYDAFLHSSCLAAIE